MFFLMRGWCAFDDSQVRCFGMAHYVCKGGCGGTLEEAGVCETPGCASQWEMMEECGCEDGKHGKSVAEEGTSTEVTKDSCGTALNDGDSVVLIKDLKLRGSSTVLKIGTKASNIRLTDNVEEIDCKLGGTAIVLRCEFVKKIG
jgi:protein PhnA